MRVPSSSSSSQHSSEHSQNCQLHPHGPSSSADPNGKSKACLDFIHSLGGEDEAAQLQWDHLSHAAELSKGRLCWTSLLSPCTFIFWLPLYFAMLRIQLDVF